MSSTWPTPTRIDHQKFCETEEWRRVRDARGRTGTHHVTFELDLVDGRTLRTRVSHPVDRTDYGKRIWAHILRDQLEVSGTGFWACVKDGRKPERGQLVDRSVQSVPAGVVAILLHQVGLTETEVAALTREQAIARVNQFWTESG